MTIAALSLVFGVGCFEFDAHFREVARAAPSAPKASAVAPASPPPGTLVDPLEPGRLITVDSTAAVDADNWITARPRFQYSRSAAQRGGVEPCEVPNDESHVFGDWVPLSRGHFSAPRDLTLGPDGRFDLVIHLLGDDPVRRELIKSRARFVLYTLTLSPNQGYAPLFTGTHLYQSIVLEIERALSRRVGREAHVGHVVLSAWSAGFVGIEAALAQPDSKDVDAVILIDGLHAPRGNELAFKAQLKPFVDYAARAAASDRVMIVSHSSIDPPDFASTTECAHYLMAQLGGTPQAVRRADPLGLELVEYFSRGNFHVRGYAGNDKADHCAQLGVLRAAYAALGRRFQGAPP